MPNRIIKESICTSETIDKMTWFEECFFHRLWVNCDDYGRMDARPAILKAKLFPLKDKVAIKDIVNTLNKLAGMGCIRLYDCDDKPYLYLPSWEEHQNIRAKRSKYPSPDNVNAHENICMQMQADENICPRNPIQSVSESNPNLYPNPIQSNAFDAFWKSYPKKIGKETAKKSWEKINPSSELLNEIINAIDRWKMSDQWQKENGQYIPNPATWLNQKRWEDELPKPKTGNPFLDMLKEENGG